MLYNVLPLKFIPDLRRVIFPGGLCAHGACGSHPRGTGGCLHYVRSPSIKAGDPAIHHALLMRLSLTDWAIFFFFLHGDAIRIIAFPCSRAAPLGLYVSFFFAAAVLL